MKTENVILMAALFAFAPFASARNDVINYGPRAEGLELDEDAQSEIGGPTWLCARLQSQTALLRAEAEQGESASSPPGVSDPAPRSLPAVVRAQARTRHWKIGLRWTADRENPL